MGNFIEFNAKSLYEYAKGRDDVILKQEIAETLNRVKEEIFTAAGCGKFTYVQHNISRSDASFLCKHIIPELEKLGFKARIEGWSWLDPLHYDFVVDWNQR